MKRPSDRHDAGFHPQCERLEDRTLLTAGALDPTFGVGGKVTTDFDGRLDRGQAVAVQPDGKILVAGTSLDLNNRPLRSDWIIVRYQADGQLDPGFHGNGKLLVDLGGDDESVVAARTLADGRLVVIGTSRSLNQGATPLRLVVARYLADGQPDPAFGGAGLVQDDFGGALRGVADGVLLGDGSVLVAANFATGPALLKYTPGGAADAGFGTAGRLDLGPDFTAVTVSRLAVQPDGQILLGGQAPKDGTPAHPTADFLVARLHADGSPDTAFGTGGFRRTDFLAGTDAVSALALQEDGKILVAGDSVRGANQHFFVGARYNADGSLDTAYASGGLYTLPVPPGRLYASVDGVAVQGDGKILLMAESSSPSSYPLDLYRLNTNGAPDITFGTNGDVALDQGFGGALALQPDGKVLIVGGSGQVGTSDVAVSRILTEADGPPNHAPLANPDSATTAEDTAVNVAVLGNDSDPDGDPLTVSVVNATNGTAAVNGNLVVFTPAADFNGNATVIYRVSDGRGGSATATVNLTVTPVNDPPTANPDAYNATRNTLLAVPVSKGVLANDTDPDGPAQPSARLVTGPAHGTLTLAGNGAFNYVPTTGFYGADSFSYKATDGAAFSTPTTVTITVARGNKPPQARPDLVFTDEDRPTTVNALANDSDPDGDALTLTVLRVTHGTAVVDDRGTPDVPGDDRLTFTGAANYGGPAQVFYRVSDGHGGFSDSVVTLIVRAVNDAPVATADAYRATADAVLKVNPAQGVLANDTDPDGPRPGRAILVAGPDHGTLAFNPAGGFTYTPAADFTGQDTFRYKATDATLESEPTTVTLTVAAPATVADVQVNGGADQRAMVTGLTVAFSDVVQLGNGAFQLTTKAGAPVPLTVTTATADGHTVATLGFKGATVVAGSLADGNYKLTINGDQIAYGVGQNVDADGDGKPGGSRTVTLFRFFGDANGDRTVDATDKAAFDAAAGTTQGQGGFLAFFDVNGDGTIDARDQAEFDKRFGKTLSP